MPIDTYHELPGLNWSRLKYVLESPRAYRHAVDNPPSETPAMAFGTAVHMAVLEPERAAVELITAPPEYLTATGLLSTAKAAKDWIGTLPADAIVLTPAQRIAIDTVCKHLAEHAGAKEWLALAHHREHVLTWQETSAKIDCKACVDAWGNGLLLDVKTWSPRGRFSPDGFMREALSRKYLGQLGWYFRGLEAAGQPVHLMGWVVIQSTAPHDVMVLELDVDAFDYALEEAQEAIDLFHLWSSDGMPAHGAYPEAVLCNLPAYLQRDDPADNGADLEGF
jgi:exodeoxyribonuclease VIII